jgi:protein TonB
MNQNHRFFAAIFIACLLHALAAPFLFKIGWNCPVRVASDALIQNSMAVSLMEITDTEQLEPQPHKPELQEPIHQSQQTPEEKEKSSNIPESVTQTLPDQTEKPRLSEEITDPAPEVPLMETLTAPSQNTELFPPHKPKNYKPNDARPKKSESSVPETTAPRTSLPAQQIDTQPVLITNPRPPYPAQARAEAAEGTVYIKIWIDASGKISDASIVKSSGRKDFDEVALRTVKDKWRFKPARSAGLPIPCEKTISVEFRLR